MLFLLFVISGAQYPGQGPAPMNALYLVPNALVDAVGNGANPVHQYGDALLAEVPEMDALPRRLQSRLTAVRAVDRITFRGFAGPIEPWSRSQVEGLPDGYYLIAFVGPIDVRWTRELESLGVTIVESAPPYALLVRGRGEALARADAVTTSFGYAAVRSVQALPVESRLDPALLDLVRGTTPVSAIPGLRTTPAGLVVVRIEAHPERTLSSVTQQIERAPPEIARGRSDVFAVERAEILRLLQEHPEVAYIEAVPERELHDNLAAKSYIMNVEPVWTEPSLGYEGAGVIVGHNDDGVDPFHPDFPAGVVVATSGAMSDTDNAHGTHTAGSVLGRGLAASSPTNLSSCGDGTAPLPTVRGTAWGAKLVTNNIFVGGQFSELSMMRWSYQQGAVISTNSWGYDNLYAYSSHAAAVDELVRDADSTAPGNQEMLIYFSAGNDGPTSATVGSPGTAKNVITVGASQNDRCGSYVPSACSGPDIDTMACFSSRGPAQGRIKPDLVAPGTDILAPQSADPLATRRSDPSWTGAAYSVKSGTSMSTPLAAGAGAAFFEFYKERFGKFPSPALAKAALVNGAVDMGLGYPSFAQGWGRLNLRNAIEGPPGGAIRFFEQAETLPLATGQTWTASFQVFSSGAPLEITLVWTDPPGSPGSTSPLVNDLDLLVVDPAGTVYRGNQLTASWSTPDPGAVTDTANNVENVFVRAPAAGSWTIQVSSARTTTNPPGVTGQDFALVYSGHAGQCAPPPAPSGLVATTPAANRVDLSWTPEPSAVAYKVYRSETSGRGFVALANVSTSSYSDLTVSGDTTYFYRVTAMNASGCESVPSTEKSALATGDCISPPEFGGISSVSSSSTSCALDLSWSAGTSTCSGSEPLAYNVYRSTLPGFNPGPSNLIEVCLAATSYADTNVSSGTTYYYIVRAEDAGASGGGPCRGGNVDDNVVERSGTPEAVASACIAAPEPVSFFTVTSSDGTNGLQWMNPSSGGDVVLTYRTDRPPANATDGTALTPPSGPPGTHQLFVHEAIANGTTYYYGAFVRNEAGDFSAGRFAEGRPDGAIPGAWVYQTGASAVSPLAPGPSTVHGFSNDRVLHGMVGGSDGGVWPPNWVPVMLNAPETRPPIVPFSIGGASRVILTTTLDGTVTAVDTDTGASAWASAVLAEGFTGAASAMLESFGGSYDLVFVGTRNTSAPNAIIALRPSDGLPVWQFDNGGGADAIGIISGSASVRYGRNALVFATRARAGGSSNTLWSISFTDTGAVLEWARALGDIDGSPIVSGDRVYVGTNEGKVYAVEADTGADVWAAPYDTADGPVKGHVWPSFGTGAIYVSTTNTVTALVDEGAAVTQKWSITSIPSPSTPVLVPGTTHLYLGGGDGGLHRLDVSTSPPASSITVLGDGTAAAGPPSISILDGMLYIGTTSGAIYALPLVF